MKRFNLLPFIILASLLACVKPYDFDPLSYEKVLVIDGQVTNESGPHQVKITYTYPLDTIYDTYVKDAEVWVEEDGGRVDFTFTEDGTYVSPDNFSGKVGHSYQLFIQLSDGSLFSSESTRLQEAPPIDSIYNKYAELPSSDETRNVGGIQFFIDSHDDTGTARYFRYAWEEAYQIKVPFPKSYEYNPEDSSLTYIPVDQQPGICYKENASTELIYTTTVGSAVNRVAEFPVRFISQEEQTLRERYTILVKQYAISESAYLFYKRLRENNESGGSLFDKQTGSVYGNIAATDDAAQPVLGYFEVSGVTTMRRFFDYEEFDKKLRVANFPYYCTSFNGIETTPDSTGYYLETTLGNVYNYSTMPPVVYIHNRGCTDCSFYADTTPPEYWTE